MREVVGPHGRSRGGRVVTDGGLRPAPGTRRPEPDRPSPEECCIDCGKYGALRCGCCGFPLCGRHHETGGGFCQSHTVIGGIGLCLIGDEAYVNDYLLKGQDTPPLAVDGDWHLPAVADAEGYERDPSADALCGTTGVKHPAPDAVREPDLCADCQGIAETLVERRREEWADAADGGEDA